MLKVRATLASVLSIALSLSALPANAGVVDAAEDQGADYNGPGAPEQWEPSNYVWQSANTSVLPGLVAETTEEAMALAREYGVAVEDRSQRTTTEVHYALPSGLWKADMYSGPQFAEVPVGEEGDSVWRSIDTTLSIDADGMVRPVAYPVDLTIAPGGRPETVLMSTGLVDSEAQVALKWDGTEVPEVQLEGSRAIYASILPGIDYVIDVFPTGFEQYYVVHSPAAARLIGDFGLDMEVEGATIAEADDGGGFDLVEDGEVIATAPSALAWDADDDARMSVPVLEEWSDEPNLSPGVRPDLSWLSPGTVDAIERITEGMLLPNESVVPMTVEADGNDVRATLDVDEDWLRDPDTTYPVVIDPSLTGSFSFDTYVRSNYPTTKFNTKTELFVGTWDSGTSKYRSYLNFHVTAVQGKDIVSAKLNLWNHHSWTCSARSWRINHANAIGTSTTWDNQPTIWKTYVTTSSTRGYSSSCPDSWTNADVTKVVQHWSGNGVSKDVYSIQLKATNESDNSYWKRFYSNDYSISSERPKLSIVYNRPPNKPTNLELQGKSATDVSKPALITTARPAVTAVVSDPDGGNVATRFAYYTYKYDGSDPGAVVYKDDTSTASGAVAKWTMTSDMSWSKCYAFSATALDGRLQSAYTPWEYFCRKNSVPNVPTNLRVDGVSGASGADVEVDSALPTFSAVVSDPDGTSTKAYFRVKYEDGTVMASGFGSSVASGGSSTWRLPSDRALLLDHKYRVEVFARDDQDWAYNGSSYRSSSTLAADWWFELANEAPETPTDGELFGEIWTVNGITYTDPRPTFTAVVSDVDGPDDVHLQLRVKKNGEYEENSGAIVGTGVTSGGVSTVTLPYSMVAGNEYEFELWAWDGYKGSDNAFKIEGVYMVAESPPREVPTVCDDQAGSAAAIGTCGGN